MMTRLPVQGVLALDAITCLVAGLAMAIGATLLSPVTGLPAELLLYAGVALLPVAAFFGWLSRTPEPPRNMVWLGIVGNLAWVVGSVALTATFNLTPIGVLLVLAQAAIVLVLALIEWRSMRMAKRIMV